MQVEKESREEESREGVRVERSASRESVRVEKESVEECE